MKTVVVVGAGPAGLFAAQKIARAGHPVIILNRDIKPGGLAEYGIYPVKEKMKGGLRKQFAKILGLPNVNYFGHIPIGRGYSLSIEELRELNPAALVFAVGAQGTKKLGLPGEDARGVYSAKDFVFFYNQLPPFTSRDFSTGKRVVIVGMGNVMVDIARWLLQDDPLHSAEEVFVVARRGPFEAKFDQKEMDHIEMHLDLDDLRAELLRVKPGIAGVGHDISKVPDNIFPILARTGTKQIKPKFKFRFLCSPKEIVPDAAGRIAKLVMTENILVPKGDGTAAKATDKTTDLEVDTMIFAIGDTADPQVGLPFSKDSYVTNPDSSAGEGTAYEVFDPAAGKVLQGTYVVGWARKASEGLVGVARFDAEKGADHVLRYLEGAADRVTPSAEEMARMFAKRNLRVVDKADLAFLGRAEAEQAKARGLASFKFAENQKMLAVIEEEKTKGAAIPADD